MSVSKCIQLLALMSCLACGSKMIGQVDAGVLEDSGTDAAAGNAGIDASVPRQEVGGAAGTSTHGGAAGKAAESSGGAGGTVSVAARDDGGAGGAGTTERRGRAMILIDQRLYQRLEAKLLRYRDAAEQRRGFAIELHSQFQIDDWSYGAVKEYILQRRQSNPDLEGVLFIGNIKLPSFYKLRNDLPYTELYPAYYEDLDASWQRLQEPGSIDPACAENQIEGCQIAEPDGRRVPDHDLDHVETPQNHVPEIWSAYMPVGSNEQVNYDSFAAQLAPYFDKLDKFYKAQIVNNGRYYLVSNDKGEYFSSVWEAFGPSNIDFYGKPPTTDSGCFIGEQNVCYARWELENFARPDDFIKAYGEWDPRFLEGWQDAQKFVSHMQPQTYEVVEVNVLGGASHALIGSSEAAQLQGVGLLLALDNANATAFRQPGSPSHVDAPNFAADNIALSFLYGSSNVLAAVGTPSVRAHYANHPKMFTAMKDWNAPAYLGKAHYLRMGSQYIDTGNLNDPVRSPDLLRMYLSEMLLGDPFMDLK